ncbi:MAG: phage terminase large subunit [Acidobacteria bacterium]|nr:phage terminase large subunit [Acidobacteriota bacterium]
MSDEEFVVPIPEGPVGYEGEVVQYEARGAAVQLFHCRDDEVVLSGPAGTGKSRACIEKIHYLLNKYPGSKALICRKTLVSLTETGLMTYKNHVLNRLDGVIFFGGSKSEPAQFKYPNGSVLIAAGLDQISKVMSSDYDIVYVQEENELSLEEHEALTTRLRNGVMPFQQLIADVNPQEPWHWILRRAQAGVTTMLESRHEDNPILYNPDGTLTPRGESYIRRLDALTGVRLQRLRHGRWVAAEGIVYEAFDPSIHLIEPFKVPPAWPRLRSIDFGFVNPMVCQWIAVDPDGRMYLYRELYRTQRLVSDMALRINELSKKEHITATLADHDSGDRATLQAAGINTKAANKAIRRGIEVVQKRLRVQDDGKPRLYIVKDARLDRDMSLVDHGLPTCTAEEMVSYAWPDGTKGNKERMAKELPMDLNNHGCLTGETLVATPTGPRRLDELKRGDMVLTRRGARKVTMGGCTGKNKPVVRLRLDNGHVLRGTGDHPIMTPDGWVPLSTLQYGSEIVTLGNVLAHGGKFEVETTTTRIMEVAPLEHADVYNLTVTKNHEYFANGVLVSNCDALRYAAMYLERRGQIVAPGSTKVTPSKWLGRFDRPDVGGRR